jgi:membrane-bound serine protease (ClpP class)
MKNCLPVVLLWMGWLGWSGLVGSANFLQKQDTDPLTAPTADPQLAEPGFARVGVIEIKGEITVALSRYFFNRLEKARQSNVDLLIVEIDSPGGLRDVSLKIASELAKTGWARTVAFVPQQAISGGALIALGCDEMIVADRASLGNIGEIAFDPNEMAWRLIRPKVESSLGHDARQLAELKNRPADLVEAFIDKDIVVYRREKPDGSWEFRQLLPEDPNGPDPSWEMVPETKPERFLTLSGKRAVELQLAQGLADDRQQLLARYGVDPSGIQVYRYTGNDTMVHLLNTPFITGLLIVIGLIALYIEFSSPGLGAGGLIAGLCMLLFFWSRYLGGTAGWLEILLFASGLVFLMMELFVIPGFGVSGIIGMILMFFSVVLASQNFTVPSNVDQWNQTINSLLVLMVSMSVFGIAAMLISRYYGSIPMLNRLVLEPPVGSPMEASVVGRATGLKKPEPVVHPVVSVGDWGVTESLLRPAGRARFAGNSVDVISDGGFVDPGQQVRVVRIQGNVVTVTEVERQS